MRAVCKHLRGIAKGGKAEARVLSVMLLALQMTGSQGHERENEELSGDQESFGTWLMTCVLQVMSFACELCDRYPRAMIAIGQVTVLVIGMMLASACFRGRPEPAQSSVQVQLGGGVQVDVCLNNNKFAKPLRDPASRGERAPGTPARAMDISSSDLEVRAQARGARSKAKSSPRARGRDDDPWRWKYRSIAKCTGAAAGGFSGIGGVALNAAGKALGWFGLEIPKQILDQISV